MPEIKYVSDEVAKAAREFEARFTALPPQSGVLFVSVEPQPEDGGKVNRIHVFLGLERSLEKATGMALIKKVLAEEINEGRFHIDATVIRGVARRQTNLRNEAAHQAAS